MPFGSGGCPKLNENSVLQPGSSATCWLRGFCSVAAAVGAEVKEGFDWECGSQPAHPDWIVCDVLPKGAAPLPALS